MIELVEVVEQVEKAIARKPEGMEHITFFSDYDLWEYHLVLDERTCEVCAARKDLDIIIGSKIRLLYPYLEIIDENTIMVREHPNCRCYLMRTYFIELPQAVEELMVHSS